MNQEITVELPDELLERYKDFSQKTGKSLSELVVEAVEQFVTREELATAKSDT